MMCIINLRDYLKNYTHMIFKSLVINLSKIYHTIFVQKLTHFPRPFYPNTCQLRCKKLIDKKNVRKKTSSKKTQNLWVF